MTGVQVVALWTWPMLPVRAYVGFPVNVRVSVLNYDNVLVPAYDVIVNVSGLSQKWETVKLLGGERKLVQFDVTPTVAGKYEVTCGGKTTSFEAVALPGAYRRITVTSLSTAMSVAVSHVPGPDGDFGFTVRPGKTLSCPIPVIAGAQYQTLLSIVPSPFDALAYWVIDGKDWPAWYIRLLRIKPQSMVWVQMSKDHTVVCEGKAASTAAQEQQWQKQS